jgi:hypothetical protein
MSCPESDNRQVRDNPDEYFLKSYVLTKRNISRGIYISIGNHQDSIPFALPDMSTVQPLPENPPARAVERIREIIVGRQLERIEQRLERLEVSGGAGNEVPSPSDPRVGLVETRIEAMEQMIQQLADAGSMHPAGGAVQQMEGRIGAWLGQWQLAMQAHLETRETRLADHFRGELSSLWEHVQVEMSRFRSGTHHHAEVEERFRRIADAARVLAACAAGHDNAESQTI